jgi:prolyl oligopeptidase
MPYGVEPIPAEIAPDTTAAYYQAPAGDGSRAGMYPVNLYQAGMRPKWEMMALRLHEAAPGHHRQIAYAQELAFMTIRMRSSASSPTKCGGRCGWWWIRASITSAGTGSRRSTPFWAMPPGVNGTSPTRLIAAFFGPVRSWPGQGLGYKIGELKIKELRRRAQAKRGDRFDVRAFHDAVLSAGAVPLDVLEKRVMDWMNAY